MCLWHDVKLRKKQLEVRSLNVTWRHDLWGHRVIVFWKCVKLLAEQLLQIWRRYAPPFYHYLRKTSPGRVRANVTWRRDLWGHRVIVFFKVSNYWLNSNGKFGGATQRRFFAICEKPEGVISAPDRARVKSLSISG